MSEDSVDKETTFIDGIKVNFGNDWALVLPDQYQPFIHIMSESKDENTARQLLEAYREKVEQWKKEFDAFLEAGAQMISVRDP